MPPGAAGGLRRRSRRARYCFPVGISFSGRDINSVDDIDIESPHQAALQ
ncbi:hypothetical protein DDI_0355 [Dickeya dianthicola RNS04.9]|nr:hypothetical protein DDI_0355 [Dickeya dianthicola RNS04.9]